MLISRNISACSGSRFDFGNAIPATWTCPLNGSKVGGAGALRWEGREGRGAGARRQQKKVVDLLLYARGTEGDRQQPAVPVPAPALLHPPLPRADLSLRAYVPPQLEAAFGRPRFGLFRRIERLYHAKEKNQLFLNLLFTYLPEIVAAVVVTLVYASLNLLVPELIRQFMHFMR